MKRKSVEQIISMAINGEDVSQYANYKAFGSRPAFRTPDQPKSGIISLYYKGELNDFYRVRDMKQMKRLMKRMIDKCANLEGEKYILWQPMLLQSESPCR